MTEAKPMTPEKAKYLSRMKKISQHSAHKVAARNNRIEQEKLAAEKRRELHAHIDAHGPTRFTYTQKEIDMMEANKMRKLPMEIQTAMLMGKLQAKAEREANEQKVLEAAQVVETPSVESAPVHIEDLKVESST